MTGRFTQRHYFSWIFCIGILLLISMMNVLAQHYVDDPALCPNTGAIFPGQNCNTLRICGNLNGTAQCFNTSSLTPPASNSANSTTSIPAFPGGGFIVDCFAAADAAAPYCDNNGNYICARNESFFTNDNRQTICKANLWASDPDPVQRGVCRSGFLDCDGPSSTNTADGDSSTNTCETQIGVSTFSGINNAVYHSSASCEDARCLPSFCYLTTAPGVGNDTCTITVGTDCTTISGTPGQYVQTGARGQCLCQACSDVGQYAWNGECRTLAQIITSLNVLPWQQTIQLKDQQLVDGASGGVRAGGAVVVHDYTQISDGQTITVNFTSGGTNQTFTLVAGTAESGCTFDRQVSNEAVASSIISTLTSCALIDDDADLFTDHSVAIGNTAYFIYNDVGTAGNGTISTTISSNGVTRYNLVGGVQYNNLKDNQTHIVRETEEIYTFDDATQTWVLASGSGAGTTTQLIVGDASNNIPGEITVLGATNTAATIVPNAVFMYDTTADFDGGKWRTDSSQSWYNETIDATGENCDPGAHDRCGSNEFPKTAALMADDDNLYIFDAEKGTMWMKFTKGSGYALDTVNDLAAAQAMDGKLYVGFNNGFGDGYGLVIIDFINDTVTTLLNEAVNDRAYFDGTLAQRNSNEGSSYDGGLVTTVKNGNINDLHVTKINGKTYVALATDMTLEVYDASEDKRVTVALAGGGYDHVWLTSNNRVYAAHLATDSLRIYHNAIADGQLSIEEVIDGSTSPRLYPGGTGTIHDVHVAENVDIYKEIAFIAHDQGVTQLTFKAGGEITMFYDNFTDGSIDTNKWDTSNATGFTVESHQVLKGTSTTGFLETANYFTSVGDILETEINLTTNPTNGFMALGVFNTTSDAFGVLSQTGDDFIFNDGSGFQNISTAIHDTAKSATIRITIVSATQVLLEIMDEAGDVKVRTTYANASVEQPIRLGRRYDNANQGQAYNNFWRYVKVTRPASLSPASVKYFNTNNITEEMFGDIRGHWQYIRQEDFSGRNNQLQIGGIITQAAPNGIRGPWFDIDSGGSLTINNLQNDFVFVPDFHQATVGAWIDPDDVTFGADYFMILLANGADQWGFYRNSGTNHLYVLGDGTGYDTGYRLKAQEKVHVVIVYDSLANKIETYINGQLYHTKNSQNFGTYNINSFLSLGTNTASASSNGFRIGEIFVTKARLTPSEIKRIHAIGSNAAFFSPGDTNNKLQGVADDSRAVFYNKNTNELLVGTNGGGVTVINLSADTAVQHISSISGSAQVRHIDYVNGKSVTTSSSGYRFASADIEFKDVVQQLQSHTAPGIQGVQQSLTQITGSIGEPTEYMFASLSGLDGCHVTGCPWYFNTTAASGFFSNIPVSGGKSDTLTRNFHLKKGKLYSITATTGYLLFTNNSSTGQSGLFNTTTNTEYSAPIRPGDSRSPSATGSWLVRPEQDSIWDFRLVTGAANISSEVGGGSITIQEIKEFYNIQGGIVPSSNLGIVSSTGGNYDLAEDYRTRDETIEAGDVVAVGEWSSEDMGYFGEDLQKLNESIPAEKTTQAKQKNVIGIISTSPGFLLTSERRDETFRPVALAGRVPLKVSDENGTIEVGDLLTPASLPGYAMKLTGNGPIIGKALESFDPRRNIGDTQAVREHLREARREFEKQALSLEIRAKAATQIVEEIKLQKDVKNSQEDPVKADELKERIADAVIQIAEVVQAVEEVKEVVVDQKPVEDVVEKMREGIASDTATQTSVDTSSSQEKLEAIRQVSENDEVVDRALLVIEEKTRSISQKSEVLGRARDTLLRDDAVRGAGTGRIMVAVQNGWAFGNEAHDEIEARFSALEEQIFELTQLLPGNQEVCKTITLFQTDAEGNTLLDDRGNPLPQLDERGKPKRTRECKAQTFNPQSVATGNLLAAAAQIESLIVTQADIRNAHIRTLVVDGAAVFRGAAEFEGPVRLSRNAGIVEVLPGQDQVTVSFDEPFETTPVILISPMLSANYIFENDISLGKFLDSLISDDITEISQDQLKKLLRSDFFNMRVDHVISNPTREGFTIQLEKPFCTADCHYRLKFNWIAVENGRVMTEGETEEEVEIENETFYQLLLNHWNNTARLTLMPAESVSVEQSPPEPAPELESAPAPIEPMEVVETIDEENVAIEAEEEITTETDEEIEIEEEIMTETDEEITTETDEEIAIEAEDVTTEEEN